MIVNCAVYDDGVRRPGGLALDDAFDAARQDGSLVWLGLYEPSAEELRRVAREFQLHPLAVEDAVHAHQRPKLERYGHCLFLVLKTARYVDHDEIVELGDVMLFVGERFVVGVRHGEACELSPVRRLLEAHPERLRRGAFEVVHAVADHVVDEYERVVASLELDIDDIQAAVFSGPRASHAARIFALKREVLDFRQAVLPLAGPLEVLASSEGPCPTVELQHYFRDVLDHVRRVSDRIVAYDTLLSDALSANVAQVGMRQNEDMRRISAWVAIVAVPTMVAGIYGMNFEHMPELESRWGYPIVLAIMVTVCGLLYWRFRKNGWL